MSTRTLTWNGTDLPAELRDLPPGRYVLEPLADEDEENRDEALIARDGAFDSDVEDAWVAEITRRAELVLSGKAVGRDSATVEAELIAKYSRR